MLIARSETVLPLQSNQFSISPSGGVENWLDEDILGDSINIDQYGYRALVVNTGTYAGNIGVMLEQYTEKPTLDVDSWDTVSEYSLKSTTGLSVTPWADAEFASTSILGWVRVSISERGRQDGENAQDVVENPVEHYRIALWPGPVQPIHVVKDVERVDDDIIEVDDGPVRSHSTPPPPMEIPRSAKVANLRGL